MSKGSFATAGAGQGRAGHNSHFGIAVKGLAVGREGGGVVAQLRRQVVADLELVDAVLAVAGGVGALADEDLEFLSVSGRAITLISDILP